MEVVPGRTSPSAPVGELPEMNWRTPHRFSALDLCFIGGVLVGAGIVALLAITGALWVARVVVGG